METHKIDQLFKQKLERHSEPVSADAFARVQAQMKGKKQKKGFPWMIAAGISMLLVASFALVYTSQQNEQNTLSQIDLNEMSQITFMDNTQKLEKPLIQVKELPKNEIKNNQVESNPTNTQKESSVFMHATEFPELNRIHAIEPTIAASLPVKAELKFRNIETDVIVEIHYQYIAEEDKSAEDNILFKNNKKLKALASEYSLADLRNAKNELFASAFQFNKKGNN